MQDIRFHHRSPTGTRVGTLLYTRSTSFFDGSVVGAHLGAHLNDRACLVKKDAGRFLLLGKTCSHKTSAFS